MWTEGCTPALLLASTLLVGVLWAAETDDKIEQPSAAIHPNSNGYIQSETLDQGLAPQWGFPPTIPRKKRDSGDEDMRSMGIVGQETDKEDATEDKPSDNDRVKRFFSIFRTRTTKSEGSKRGPGFRSWGGKRSGMDKRVGFSSWGGKRDDSELNSNKGEGEFLMPFEQFQKRWSTEQGTKRRPFQSWGGKRNFFSNGIGGPLYLRQADIRKLLSWEGKRRFSSWGGKRSEGALIGENDLKKRGSQTERKKPSFKSWGGKRSDYEDQRESDDEFVSEY